MSYLYVDNIQPFTAGGDVTLSNPVVSGSLIGNYLQSTASTTASIDCSKANFFDITLPDSGDCHISASNIVVGQTINIIVNTGSNTTGTVSYNGFILEPSGSGYTPTQAANSIDALSAVSALSGSTPVLYVVSVKNFI